MTPPSLLEDSQALRGIQARARQWSEVLHLPFRQQRWRGQNGEFMGAGVGSSLDFQDHRVYLPGDDPRQINWQAYARTGTYTMKLYREEVRPLVDLVLDGSASMFAFPEKAQRTMELFAFAVEASLRSGASLRCYAVRGATYELLNLELLLKGQWPQTLHAKTAAPNEAPVLSRLPFRPGAMRVLVSDLLYPDAPDSLLAYLSQRGGRGIVLAPFDEEESAPDWDGNFEFVDSETQATHDHRVETELLKRYQQAYHRHFELWKGAAIKHGIALARVPAALDFQKALQMEGVPCGAIAIG